MKIDLGKLVQLQISLDHLVFTNWQVNYAKTARFRKLAILVEIGELANEIKSFKFWSKNKRVDQNRIIDELVDVMHFLLSALAATKTNVNTLTITGSTKKVRSKAFAQVITLKLIELFECVANASERDPEALLKALVLLIKLGFALGFSWPMIKRAYQNKNAVNVVRQKTNY